MMTSIGDEQSRMWATFCHLSALLASMILPTMGHIIGPLVIWLIKKDFLPFVNENGKEALNFQISMTIYGAIIFPFCFILIGIPFMILLLILDIVFTIIASINANKGILFRYPMTFRFIK